MKTQPPNEYRARTGPVATDDSAGMKGMFFIPFKESHVNVLVNVAPQDKQHISINAWRELKVEEIKEIALMFWDEEEIKDIVWHVTPSRYQLNANIIHVVEREECMALMAITNDGLSSLLEPNNF